MDEPTGRCWWGWGKTEDGQLCGTVRKVDEKFVDKPMRIPELHEMASIECGEYWAVGVNHAGVLFGWGNTR